MSTEFSSNLIGWSKHSLNRERNLRQSRDAQRLNLLRDYQDKPERFYSTRIHFTAYQDRDAAIRGDIFWRGLRATDESLRWNFVIVVNVSRDRREYTQRRPIFQLKWFKRQRIING